MTQNLVFNEMISDALIDALSDKSSLCHAFWLIRSWY